MPAQSASVSLRLPAKLKARLDLAARRQRKSRSLLIIDALTKHLAPQVGPHRKEPGNPSFDAFMALLDKARSAGPLRSAEEIDTGIRDFRES